MARQAKLTELEGATLGILAQRGEVTSYAVARMFKASPSEFWSGSAGAVYPMLRRLKARRLVSTRPARQGRRRSTLYALTPAGRAAMTDWLLDAERASGMGYDPLRTRLLFLDLAPSRARAELLQNVETRTREQRKAPAFEDDPQARAIHEDWFQRRLAWLAKLRG